MRVKALDLQSYRLDITMQSLIQHIFSQCKILIFICLVHKDSVILLARVALGTKTNIVFYVNRVDGQKFTRNAKKNLETSKIQNYLDILIFSTFVISIIQP